MSNEKDIALSDVITTALKIPGVKVDREIFLRQQFKDQEKSLVEKIVDEGPIAAGISQDKLLKLAHHLVKQRTLASTTASFAAGLPGGLAIAVTIPADMAQFYGVALRMAQEIAYLYGQEDLWHGNELDDEKVNNQLMLYCGVMLGVAGATQLVRLMSSALASQLLKKLPQKALTKGVVYPVVKSVAKFFGIKMTKNVFAKGVSKAVPILGGVVSGGMTLASMKPMGTRLVNALDESHFSYTEIEMKADWQSVRELGREEVPDEEVPDAAFTESIDESMEKISKAQKLLEAGVITEEEFSTIKARIISEM